MPTSTITKERGWIAHAHEVRAILDDRQTQFRRPMKPQPECGASCPTCVVCGMDKPPRGRSVPMESAAGYCCSHDCKGYWEEPLTGSLWPGESQGDFGYPTDWMGVCPFGKVGDRLWVREMWGEMQWASLIAGGPPSTTVEYQAGPHPFGRDQPHGWTGDNKWKPSIHMKRKDSRINLEVTDVRTERVQEISEEDIKAEGLRPDMVDSGGVTPWGAGIDIPDYHEPWMELWDSVNAKRGFGWETNPFVWCVSFERVSL